MAEAHWVKGEERWWPDRYRSGKRMLLDPKLSPMDNCWRVIRAQVSIWLTKFKVWSYRKEDMEDLELECQLATFSQLKYIVKNKEYNRNFSFWLNCRRAAWSVVSNKLRIWLKRQREKLNLVYCTEKSGDLFAGLSTSTTPKLMTSYDIKMLYDRRNRPRTPLSETKQAASAVRILCRMIDVSYDEYVDDCDEFGLPPISKTEFTERNFKAELEYVNKKFDFSLGENGGKLEPHRPKICPYPSRSKEGRRWYYERSKAKQKAAKQAAA